MRFFINKIIIMSSISLVVMMGVFIAAETYGEDNITMKRLFGSWCKYDCGCCINSTFAKIG